LTQRIVDLEKPRPFAAGNIEKILRAIDAEIIDQDLACRPGLNERVATRTGREVGGDPAKLSPRCRRSHRGDGVSQAHGALRSPVDDDGGAANRNATDNG